MARYVISRLIQAPIVFFLLVTLSFFIIRLAPGGPFSNERRLDPEVLEALNSKFGLDKPLLHQYYFYLFDLLHGDLGPSLKHKNTSVNEIIASTLPISFIVGSLALSLALLWGIPAGILSSLRPNSPQDYGFMVLAVLGISLPTFVLGPLFQFLFSIKLNWLPIAGFEGIQSPTYLILPAITLAIPFAARISRLMRSGMLEILKEDFIRTAKSKGLPKFRIVYRHAFRGGILPVVSFLGPAIASIATGSLVVEKIFQIPGLGREFIEAALNRDYTLVMGTVIVYGLLILFFNFVVDMIYAFLDPRVRFD